MTPAGLARILSELTRGIGKGAMFSVQMSQKSVRALKVALDQRARAQAVMLMTHYIMADQTYYGVLERIPAGPQWSSYRKSIRLARFGSQRSPRAYAVYAEPSARSQSFDTARTVLYVKPKKNFMGKISKEVLVLAKYSPWTAETLPFSPKKNEAVIVTRKVTKQEMLAVTTQREKDRTKWRKELSDAGVRNINLTKKPPELKTQVVQDLTFDALRLEFGYGGARAVPHWRPSAREAMRFAKRLFRGGRRTIFSKALTDPNYRAWRKWPPRVESSIKIGTLKRVAKFTKRLKIRV